MLPAERFLTEAQFILLVEDTVLLVQAQKEETSSVWDQAVLER